MATKAFGAIEIRIIFGDTYVIYAGNSASDLDAGRPPYSTHGNLSRKSVAAIMRQIAAAVDNDDANVTLQINNGGWIIPSSA